MSVIMAGKLRSGLILGDKDNEQYLKYARQ